MTTIVWRDGVMAADSRGYGGDKCPIGQKQKIRRLEDGTLVGCSSNTPGQPEAVLDWYAAGADIEKAPKFPENRFRFLAVKPDGMAFLGEDSFYLAGPLRAEFYAVGSGQEYALGALHMGASAERAVQIAVELDVWSGGAITVLRQEA